MNELLNSALQPSTRLSYLKIWKHLLRFLTSIDKSTRLPIKMKYIGIYVTHLWKMHFKPSSIKTYLSAISYFHKVQQMPDPCNNFLIRQLVKGTTKRHKSNKPKFRPFSKDILCDTIQIISKLYNYYDAYLYKSLFTLAYYACLRASEAVVTTSDLHTLTFDNIHIDAQNNSLVFKFNSYKHCNHPTDTFIINSIPQCSFCPVLNLKKYLSVRPSYQGPLFISKDGTPVTRNGYANAIKTCITEINKDPSHYNTHSLRIGRATDLALAGVSPEVIKTTGRWSSSAYLKYIRFDSFTLPIV